MDNGDFLNYKNEKTSKYEIVNENHIKWFIDGKSNEKDAVFECDFYRLEPTITTLKKEDIEKIDSTFFVSMYFNGKRNGSIPIKEVTSEFLKLCLIPTGPMEMTAYRKE